MGAMVDLSLNQIGRFYSEPDSSFNEKRKMYYIYYYIFTVFRHLLEAKYRSNVIVILCSFHKQCLFIIIYIHIKKTVFLSNNCQMHQHT